MKAHIKEISSKSTEGTLSFNCIYVKKTYQFRTHCKDDVMISLHKYSKNLLG